MAAESWVVGRGGGGGEEGLTGEEGNIRGVRMVEELH